MEKFSYLKCAAYLDSSLIFGIKPDLSRINEILKLLGNPHKKDRFYTYCGLKRKNIHDNTYCKYPAGPGFKSRIPYFSAH